MYLNIFGKDNTIYMYMSFHYLMTIHILELRYILKFELNNITLYFITWKSGIDIGKCKQV